MKMKMRSHYIESQYGAGGSELEGAHVELMRYHGQLGSSGLAPQHLGDPGVCVWGLLSQEAGRE